MLLISSITHHAPAFQCSHSVGPSRASPTRRGVTRWSVSSVAFMGVAFIVLMCFSGLPNRHEGLRGPEDVGTVVRRYCLIWLSGPVLLHVLLSPPQPPCSLDGINGVVTVARRLDFGRRFATWIGTKVRQWQLVSLPAFTPKSGSLQLLSAAAQEPETDAIPLKRR